MFFFILASLLLAAVAVGVVALVLQTFAVAVHVRDRKPLPKTCPPISILKPLCGADDRLEENLECFANLDYPNYEVVLGLKDSTDSAYPVALAALKKWPQKFRLEMQHGEPGYNPKVNQLVTLEAAARHDILVVSDSNTQVDRDYLLGIAQAFEDTTVACVTHPVVGKFEKAMGSRMDNLHLCCCLAGGQISAKRIAGKDIVIGKSMAFRRSDLEAMGGFYAMRNYLAEDYVIGRWVKQKLKNKRVVVALGRVLNVSENKDISSFYKRYERWAIIQRTAVTMITNVGQICMNPVPLVTLALMLYPASWMLAVWAFVVALRFTVDLTTSSLLRQQAPMLQDVAAIFLKDFVTFYCWCKALVNDTVNWRGNTLRVVAGSRLVPLEGARGSDDYNDGPEDTHPAAGSA